MFEKPWLESYGGETIEQLVQLEDRYRIDSLIVALEQALDQKSFRSGDDALSESEATVLAVEAFEREINNGGYGQFFYNSSNEYVGRIVADLARIGCAETARLTETAIAALGLEIPDPETVGKRVLEDDASLENSLEKCDDAFFQMTDNIEGRLFAFIKANMKEFKIP